MENNRNKGFTLVELAIVLVIIGLLIGGILAGRELLDNARVVRFATDVQTYSSSYIAFFEKYDSAPGDMATARSRIRECTAATFCYNGNNDSITGTPSMDWSTDDQSGDNTLPAVETTMFWKHLLLSDFVSGTTVNSNPLNPIWGETHPSSEMGGGFHVLYSSENIGGVAVSSTRLIFRGKITGNAHPTNSGDGSLSPLFASKVDRKMDDGHAFTGRISADGTGTNCFNSDGDYMPNENNGCLLSFRIGG